MNFGPLRKEGGAVVAAALLLLLVLSSLSRTLEAAEAVDDEVVSLPPFLIEEKERPLNWRYLAIDGVEVISLCSDEVTTAFLQRCRRLDHALTLILPERLQFQTNVPRTQILFNENLQRARSQEVIKEMLRREGRDAPPTSGPIRVPGLSLPGRSSATAWQQTRVHFLPNLRLNDMDGEATFAATNEYDAEQLQFTYIIDRVAYLLERRVPALPDWFVQGLLGVYERCQLAPDGIGFDPAVWISEQETRELQADEFRPRTLLPTEELLTRRRSRGNADEDERERIWRAQTALFVRWALLERGEAGREALWTLVERLETEAPSEELLHTYFGLGYSDLRDHLSDYLPEAIRQRASVRAPKLEDLPGLRPRPATAVEVSRLRGDWERMEISYVSRRWPELADRYVEQARRTLQQAYRDGARDPELLAIIGLTEYDAGNPDGGRAYLEAAALARVRRPRVYLELARERFEAELASFPEGGKIGQWKVNRILEPLRTLRELDLKPPLPGAYAILAEVWTRSEEAPSAEELQFLTRGIKQFPRLSPLLYRAIYLNAAFGQEQAVVELAQLGLVHAAEPQDIERFRQLLERLTSTRVSEASPPSGP